MAKILQKISKIINIGDETTYRVNQIPEDFEKQVEKRFRGKFEKAWKEAIDICKSHDKGILLSQRYFLYKPRRDKLAIKWSEMIQE